MPLAVGKPHHLVFERRAVARTDAVNLAVVQRRLADVLPHESLDALGRVKQIAGDLGRLDRRVMNENGTGGIVAALLPSNREKSMLRRWSRAACRSSGDPSEAERLQRFRQVTRRRFARAARRPLLRPDVNEPVEKRSGRDDQRIARHDVAVLEREPADAPVPRSVSDRRCRRSM